MQHVFTPEQMRELDRRTIEDLGLPGMVLMELAACGAAEHCEKLLDDVQGADVLVFCGPGNNGGDGYAVARRLFNLYAHPVVYLLADRDRIKGDALQNLQVYERLGGRVVDVSSSDQLAELPPADLIVDAIMGTGLHGAVKGIYADAINAINEHDAPVLAVDIPSGVNGATGAVEGPVVFADVTATFGGLKAGLVLAPGLDYTGKVEVVDIQIPPEFMKDSDTDLYLMDEIDIHHILPHRRRSAYKGDAGYVLVVAGSRGMSGAAALTAGACLRAGAGMVKAATPESVQLTLAGHHPEVMTIPLPENDAGSMIPESEEVLKDAKEWAAVLAFGPGLTQHPDTVAWVQHQVETVKKPMVIDADGLNALAQKPELLQKLNPDIILTPHIGEFARLTGLSVKEISRDRVAILRKYANEWNAVLLLKGVPTLVTGPGVPVYALMVGNPGMATAGMGDVLTGTIAGLLAQGVFPVMAAVAGTALHGMAGDLAVEEIGSTGLMAGDVMQRLPLAFDVYHGRPRPKEAKEMPAGLACACEK